jgi:hypothetical protein
MVPSRDLAARFEAYADWRRRLSSGVSALHEWLQREHGYDGSLCSVQRFWPRMFPAPPCGRGGGLS